MRASAFALLFALLASPAFAESPQVTALMARAEAAAKEHDVRTAFALVHEAEKLEPDNVTVLARLARLSSDMIDEDKSADGHKLAADSLRFAQRAVQLDPKSAKAHLALAVAFGRMTDYVGNKTKIEYSRTIKDETTRSIELDPKDDFAWHLLGRWHLGVANVNGVLKTLARVVYGRLPPASNEDALKCMKKAVSLAPRKIMHHAELAHVYAVMGKKDLELLEWQTVLSLHAGDADDRKYQDEARAALDAAKLTSQR